MVKFIVIAFFFVFLGSCSLNHKPQSSPTVSKTDDNQAYPINRKVKLPNSKDFPYVKPLSNKDISILLAQIKENSLFINNLTPNQVLNLLGTPLVIKKDNNIEIWQYRNQCVLNIIWKIHKNPTSYYLSYLENTKINTHNDLNYSIIWINSLTNDKKAYDIDKCLLQSINFTSREV